MIRIAEKADLPAILDIYAPYILTSTATFEYDVPSPEAFAARFDEITEPVKRDAVCVGHDGGGTRLLLGCPFHP